MRRILCRTMVFKHNIISGIIYGASFFLFVWSFTCAGSHFWLWMWSRNIYVFFNQGCCDSVKLFKLKALNLWAKWRTVFEWFFHQYTTKSYFFHFFLYGCLDFSNLTRLHWLRGKCVRFKTKKRLMAAAEQPHIVAKVAYMSHALINCPCTAAKFFKINFQQKYQNKILNYSTLNEFLLMNSNFAENRYIVDVWRRHASRHLFPCNLVAIVN